MALLTCEGFTKYREDTRTNTTADWKLRAYSNATIYNELKTHPLSGRFLTNTVNTAYLAIFGVDTPAAQATYIVNFNFIIQGDDISDTEELIAFNSYDAQEFTLDYQAKTGFLQVSRGATLLATADGPYLKTNQWYHIEVKVTLNDTTGAYEVRLDGKNVLSDTNVDTLSSSTRIGNIRVWGDPFEQHGIADLLVMDGEGSSLNDFIGQHHIETILPDGDGNRNDWTPDSGLTNYTQVDDGLSPDFDTSYVESSTAGQDELYTFAALTQTANTIRGVMVNVWGKPSDAGWRTVRGLARSSTSESTGTQSMTFNEDRYRLQQSFIEQNPNGPAAWTESAVNAAEFGFELDN